MTASPYDYMPSAQSVISAYAQALTQLWDLPGTLWRVLVEFAYEEDPDLTLTSTTVNLPLPNEGEVQLTVTASRLTLTGGRQAPVNVKPREDRLVADPPNQTQLVRIDIKDADPCGLYQLEFTGVGNVPWPKQTRTVNFAPPMVDP